MRTRYIVRTTWPALVLLLVAGPCASAPRGPDSPGNQFGFRNPGGPDPEQGELGGDAVALAKAFGKGRLTEAKAIAETLLSGTRSPDERAIAVRYLVESYLAEGDYEGARRAIRKAADALPDSRGVLARILSVENADRTETLRLEAAASDTGDAVSALRARLRLAEWHHRHGRLQTAAEIYERLIEERPDAPGAGAALTQLVAIRLHLAGPDEAVLLATTMLDRYSSSRTVVRAAVRSIASVHLMSGDTGRALQALQQIAARTRVALRSKKPRWPWWKRRMAISMAPLEPWIPPG